ncbi:MAG: XisH family protein [candidate division KSB1 bacterium]|nr:XisH family protein [candidate division KSB1 bacterium]MDZ7303884.1 XisH family protein [candidate division KSB1 bacterium]MDZ7313192.1 XisH family protein [candidate division KSB1 bacterium]
MPAKDSFHDIVKNALVKDGWKITHDPLILTFGRRDLYVDFGAELPIGAEKDGRKIAVEVKSFMGKSDLNDFKNAMGAYIVYQSILRRIEPDRTLYLAIEKNIYDGIFSEDIGDIVLEDFDVHIIIFEESKEVILKWLN